MRPPPELIPLGDVVSVRGGGTPDTKVDSYWNGDIPWVSPKDMKSAEVGSSQDTVTQEALANSAASLIPKDSILIVVRSGILARTVPVARTTKPLAINQDIKALVPEKRLDPRYLHYFMRASEPDLLKRVSKGATVHRLRTDDLRRLLIPIPPLAEQQRIVALVDKVFAGIAAAESAYRDNLASAKVFGQIALRVILEGDGDGWEAVSLREVASVESGAGFPEAFQGRLDEPLAFFKVGDMNAPGNEVAVRFPRHTVSEETRAQLGARVFPTGSVIFPKVGGAIATDKKRLVGRPCCVDNNVMGVIPNPSKLNSELLHQLMINKPLTDFSNDAGLPSIRKTTVEAWRFKLPVDLATQRSLAARLAEVGSEARELGTLYERRLNLLAELKQSFLARAFSGDLTITAAPGANDNDFATPEQAANILALMHCRHEQANRGRFFGHVMGQKTLDLVERIGRVELGRSPYKDAAGPNDRVHMASAERWAKEQGFFEFVQRHGGGYDFRKLANHDVLLAAARTALKAVESELGLVTNILVGKDKIEAEVFDTVLAAWNNLVADGADVTDAAIIYEARDNWHADKLAIPVSKFQNAIREISRRSLVPDGTAKIVRHRQASLP